MHFLYFCFLSKARGATGVWKTAPYSFIHFHFGQKACHSDALLLSSSRSLAELWATFEDYPEKLQTLTLFGEFSNSFHHSHSNEATSFCTVYSVSAQGCKWSTMCVDNDDPFLILSITRWHIVDGFPNLSLQRKWMLIKMELWAELEGGGREERRR